jgi:hypothetical protein
MLAYEDHANLFKLSTGDSVDRVTVTKAGDMGINTVPTSTLHVRNNDDNANVTIFNLEGKRPTPTNNDTIYIYYRLNNDNSDSYEYARTTITAEDVTDGEEEGSLLFEVSRNGSLEIVQKMSATDIVFNEPGADRDFRVEGIGAINALFVQGSDGNVGIGTGTPAYELEVNGNMTGGTPTLLASELGDTSDPHLLVIGELRNTILTNSESVGADEWDFPARAEGWNFMFVIEAVQNVTLDPNGTEQWYLNGVQLAAGEAIVNTAPTVGEAIECVSTESAVYCESNDPDWQEETP